MALLDASKRFLHDFAIGTRSLAVQVCIGFVVWHSGLALNEASATVCPTAGASSYLDVGFPTERVTLVAPDTHMAIATCRVVAVLAPSHPILRVSSRMRRSYSAD
ncbi:hypothetical protein A9K69_13635 [Stenotrophomonas maltophilia]|nr:hypothetical protein A9K69_13635 [Stenotrophomonas maltophilia]